MAARCPPPVPHSYRLTGFSIQVTCNPHSASLPVSLGASPSTSQSALLCLLFGSPIQPTHLGASLSCPPSRPPAPGPQRLNPLFFSVNTSCKRGRRTGKRCCCQDSGPVRGADAKVVRSFVPCWSLVVLLLSCIPVSPSLPFCLVPYSCFKCLISSTSCLLHCLTYWFLYQVFLGLLLLEEKVGQWVNS